MVSAETFRVFGEKLRARRIEQQRSLEDIASAIKINRRHLESIESGDLSLLPQGPYVAAFVREYARALGMPVPPEYAPQHAPTASSPRDPKVVSHPARPGDHEETGPIEAISQVARETARLANTAVKGAVKTVTKTTESVVNLVETGSKDALEVLTSRELWDEAEDIRRERHGLPPLERRHEDSPKAPTQHAPEAGVVRPARITAPTSSPLEGSFESGSAPIRIPRRTTNIVIVGLAIVFAGVAFLAIRSTRNQNGTAIPSRDYVPAPVENLPPPVKQKTEAPAQAPAVPAAPETVPAGDSLQFQLRATQPVWVSIAPDGVPAYRGQMSAGEVRSFKAGQKFVIDIGNQKAVTMTFDGAPLSGLPAVQHSNVVVRDLVLTRNHASLGGSEVDLHKLATPPPAPIAKAPASIPLPPIAKKMESLAKKAHETNAPQIATPKPASGKQSSASKHRKKSEKFLIPLEPIHPVQPIPPGP